MEFTRHGKGGFSRSSGTCTSDEVASAKCGVWWFSNSVSAGEEGRDSHIRQTGVVCGGLLSVGASFRDYLFVIYDLDVPAKASICSVVYCNSFLFVLIPAYMYISYHH